RAGRRARPPRMAGQGSRTSRELAPGMTVKDRGKEQRMSTPGYKTHRSSQFNAELEDVRQRVLAMGGLVEQQIVDATRALMELDTEIATRVYETDDKADQFEI